MVGKLGRTVAVVALVVLLVISLGAANLVIGVERTALNGDFVADSLAEEDAYAVFLEEAQSQLENENETTGEGPSPDELLSTVVTEQYLQNQTEANIDRAYAYLHGDREDLYLAVNTTPLKDDLAAELAAQLMAEQGIAEYDPRLASMTESESKFQAVREEFKAEQKERIQEETTVELTDEQLETAYDDRRDQIREETIAEFETQVEESEQPAELESAIVDLGTVYIEALVAEDPSYEQFMTDVEDARADLEVAVEQFARQQLDEELPDTMELTEQLSQEDRQQLDQLRGLVSLLDILVLVLPLVALGAALLLGWVTVARSSGLLIAGAVITVTGLIEALGFMGLGGRAESEIAAIASQGDMSAGISELAIGVVNRVISVFVTQSWVLVVLGLVLVALGIAIRRGLVDIDDHPDGDAGFDRSGSESDGGSADQPTADRSSVDVSGESEDLERADPVGDVDRTEDET
ncbi:MAG: hypothetical protein U5K70_06050 [Halodesulfurarchaeum sp.]|nr:hypothetical protein [Halodesulfurarchaeum sp.]